MPRAALITKNYSTLRQKVQETLLWGQQKIEETKVQTYWRTGKIISDHILNQNNKDNYGKQVIEKLSADLNISESILRRCVQFARSFKISAARRESLPAGLSWAHYRELITIPDENQRASFLRQAQQKKWSSRELSQKIRQKIKHTPLNENPITENPITHKTFPKLIARKGALYTYRLIETDPLHKKHTNGLRVDLGFKTHQQLPTNTKKLKAGQIIESCQSVKRNNYTANLSKRTDKDLFTYKAFVERVVDGDTLYVDVDLGFKSGTFQYLRLRGINCPEMNTPEGKKAKAFVERELAHVPYIILTSTRSDKYDRYLADIWIPKVTGDVYLNQKLLDEGLAERME